MKVRTGNLTHEEVCFVIEQAFPDANRVPGGYELRVVPKKKFHPYGIRKAQSYISRIHIVFSSGEVDVHADREFEIAQKHHVDKGNELAIELAEIFSELFANAETVMAL